MAQAFLPFWLVDKLDVLQSLLGTCSTSDFGLNRIRWYEKSLPGTNSTSDYVLSHIRWCAHPEVFKFNTSIYAFDQIRWCTTSNHAFSHIRWSICSETLKFTTSIYALGQIRWANLNESTRCTPWQTTTYASDLAYAFFILLLVSWRTLPRTSEVCFCSISASASFAESMTDCGFAPTSSSSPTRRSAWFRIR